MEDFNWTCPHCQRHVTIGDARYSQSRHTTNIENTLGQVTALTAFTVCPNKECSKLTFNVALWSSQYKFNQIDFVEQLFARQLIPSSGAKTFPEYVPVSIREDYVEACLIKENSPKASATLSRRCLQGILRDFWKIKPGRLVDEITQIKDRVDDASWAAIDAVRSLGNIGAHMEKDINVIVDVDPSEAELLTGLIENLILDWYVARHEKGVRMAAIVAAATAKK